MTRSLLVLALLAAPSLVHAQVLVAPPDGTHFQYTNRRVVHDGYGAYEGWGDQLVASGRYELSSAGSSITVHGAYRWRYDGGDRHERGTEDRRVRVEIVNRVYAGRTDLDEYDDTTETELTTWVWIPSDAAVGSHVRILERDFLVISRTASITVAGAPRNAISLEASGTGTRHDDYGDFTTSFTDRYWFDVETGAFLAEQYDEHDDGTFEGDRAGFEVTERVSIVDASYAPAVGPIPPDPLDALEAPEVVVPTSGSSTSRGMHRNTFALVVGAGLFGLIGLVLFVLRRGNRRAQPLFDGKSIETETLAAGAQLPSLPNGTSLHFTPFLSHFAELARKTNNPIAIARAGGQVCGIAFGDTEAKVASIFAVDAEVCEQLRKKLDTNDFFAELRHGNLPSVVSASQATGSALSSSHAYNVLETYSLLRLSPLPSSLSYDSSIVGRLETKDVEEAAALLAGVHGVPCRTFLDASLALGDVAYVARVGGKIVGIGLASLSGTTGRLHSLAVHPEHRSKGLGKELVRARLRALGELGATSVIAEIATWNLASLEIARAHGLASFAEMYVESARTEKADARVVRR